MRLFGIIQNGTFVEYPENPEYSEYPEWNMCGDILLPRMTIQTVMPPLADLRRDKLEVTNIELKMTN